MRNEKLGGLAAEFDSIHSVARAVEVGSVDRVVSVAGLRADLIDTIERGVERFSPSPAVLSRIGLSLIHI